MEVETDLEHDHSPHAIARRLQRGPDASYLRDWVYGGIDGAVTTFAIVAGALGADLAARFVIIMGIANLVADGFSMAAANYSGTRAENDDFERIRAMEERRPAAWVSLDDEKPAPGRSEPEPERTVPRPEPTPAPKPEPRPDPEPSGPGFGAGI